MIFVNSLLLYDSGFEYFFSSLQNVAYDACMYTIARCILCLPIYYDVEMYVHEISCAEGRLAVHPKTWVSGARRSEQLPNGGTLCGGSRGKVRMISCSG